MTYHFSTFLLDSDARQLLRDGKEVRLAPKAFDLLRMLVARRPDVLSKRDLLAAIWPDTFVVEANLNVVVAGIRRALGDDPHAPRFIRTVHGIGYAFSGHAVEVYDATRPSADSAEGRISRCCLRWQDRTFTLSHGDNVIGRDPRCDVWLDDDSVSRRHATIRVDEDVAWLQDLESTNGTFRREQLITSSTALEDGDSVSVGSVTLTFRTWSEKAARTRRLRKTGEE